MTEHSPPANVTVALEELERRLGGARATGRASDARLGVVALTIPTGSGPSSGVQPRRIAFRAHESFPSASTIKVFVLQTLLEEVAAGHLRLDDERVVDAADMVTGSGVIKVLTPGRRHPLLDLATLMITVSDNTATNVLIDLLGIERIRACVDRNRWSGTFAAGKLQVGALTGNAKPSPSMTTPADLADYFARLWRGELLPPAETEVAKSIYRRQQLGELGRALDYDGYSAELGVSPLRIASKSGSIRGVRNDAGVFEPVGPAEAPVVVMAVMTRGCPDERFHPENLGARVVGDAAALLYRELTGPS